MKDKNCKALFFLKITMDEDLLDHIGDIDTPKRAWDIFVELFSRMNNAQLQHYENELMNIKQEDMTISQYFVKIKSLCREIT